LFSQEPTCLGSVTAVKGGVPPSPLYSPLQFPANVDKRADEQTRNADCLLRVNYACCRVLQTVADHAYLSGFSSMACRALHRVAFAAVSGVRGIRVASSYSNLAHAPQYAAPPDVAVAPDTLMVGQSLPRPPQAVYTEYWMQTSGNTPSTPLDE
jgi:hypothetical protein